MRETLASILSGQVLSEQEAAQALMLMLSGEIHTAQAASFLAVVQSRGLHLSELRGFHSILAEQGLQLNFADFDAIDVCGTGGDGKNTFNISTLTAFVLAGAGFKVAKHGNASATSGCGSSDVLQALGVKFTNDESVLRRQIETANICYLHAPFFQPALKTVASLRREIGFRTFFNLLGPLLNPARPKFQFVGVFEPAVQRLYRYFLEDTATNFAVVHSRDGYDEISLTAAFDLVTNEGSETFYPEDLGFPTVASAELHGGKTAEECAEQCSLILQGEGTPTQNQVVIANAAFAIRLMKPEFSLADCIERTKVSLLSGAAFAALEKLICQNHLR
jgi:anthranilate phosphoribosyltransferase